ncbi:hypothetical protein EXIGLDRAFT_736998 [Exidia glandulosa HHB12029]|uniref:Uncharacterized protein n=1 Tax=Exidia glandulosa HHB12029 TaxID=1314781 RepID=A0A166N2K2_EXIGL|nr:hypothetical protein EXIGLDRAFT_736998 [Exidia glandulosa HHB12029]
MSGSLLSGATSALGALRVLYARACNVDSLLCSSFHSFGILSSVMPILSAYCTGCSVLPMPRVFDVLAFYLPSPIVLLALSRAPALCVLDINALPPHLIV